MSFNKYLIPFKRREEKDETIMRITSSPVKLETSPTFSSMFEVNKIKNQTKHKQSVYSLKLLEEILPSINKRVKKKKEKPPLPKFRANSASNEIQKISTKYILDKIEEEKTRKIMKVNTYEKKCNIKKHITGSKFISHFLTPLNNFICKDFKLYNDEYEEITRPLSKKNKNIFSLIKHPVHNSYKLGLSIVNSKL